MDEIRNDWLDIYSGDHQIVSEWQVIADGVFYATSIWTRDYQRVDPTGLRSLSSGRRDKVAAFIRKWSDPVDRLRGGAVLKPNAGLEHIGDGFKENLRNVGEL